MARINQVKATKDAQASRQAFRTVARNPVRDFAGRVRAMRVESPTGRGHRIIESR